MPTLQHYHKQATAALAAYYERGLKALAHLQHAEWDEAEAILRKRKAAFHNFRVASVLAQSDELQLFQSHEWQILWDHIKDLDQKLEQALEAMAADFQVQLRYLKKEKNIVGKYRSCSKSVTTFRGTI